MSSRSVLSRQSRMRSRCGSLSATSKNDCSRSFKVSRACCSAVALLSSSADASCAQLQSDVPCDLVALRQSRSSRPPQKMTSHGRRDKDCVPNLAFNRFTSTFLDGSSDEEVVFIEPMATEGSKGTSLVG